MTLPKDPLFEEVDAELAKPHTATPEEAMFEFLESLGVDMTDPNTVGTPARVAKMYREELLAGYSQAPPNMTTFPIPDVGNEQVTVKGIPVMSLCAHHLMPIVGFAAVSAFFMEDSEGLTRLPGLSKYARVVDMFARRLQLQETLTGQICKYMLENTEAVWVGVHIKAEHFCMSARGVKMHGAETITKKFHRKILTREDNRLDFFIDENRSEELKRSFLDEVLSK